MILLDGRFASQKGTRLKQFFLNLAAKWKIAVALLSRLGFWGAALASVLDSSSVPVPMDLFIAGWVWNNKSQFWIYCMLAAAGSAVGGLLPYWIGRGGGELLLLKHVNRVRFEQLRLKFERQEFLAIMIPSMLPPPAPWKVFVFAAGVFEMRVLPFMLAVFCGRMARWMLLSLLVLKLGPSAVDIVAHHALTAFLVACGLAVAGFGWWWFRGRRKAPLKGQEE